LDTFLTFLKLCAGSSGQELNLSRLGSDAGITQTTAKAWLTVLEAGFLVFRTPAWHANLRKRLVKTPKLHFLDAGLQCRLLGIQHASQIQSHPLRGAIFESWVASEILKMRRHAGQRPEIFHLRENAGLEVDLVVQDGLGIRLIEAKSGQTMDGRFLAPLKALVAALSMAHPEIRFSGALVYGGDLAQDREGFRVLPWGSVPALAPDLPAPCGES
jgi:predicted AAA+ superfamily ATPase